MNIESSEELPIKSNTEDSAEQKKLIEQKEFPNSVKIAGGTMPATPFTRAEKYEDGQIDISPDGSITFSGFGLEELISVGSPSDLLDLKNVDNPTYIDTPLPQLPKIDPFLRYEEGEHLSDAINLVFYMCKQLNPNVFNFIKTKDEYQLDKVRIASTDFNSLSAAQLIESRPDLTTEIFRFACREHVFNKGHSRHHMLIDYLASNPEKMDLFPEDIKPQLIALFITSLGRGLRDSTLSEFNDLVQKNRDYAAKLKIDLNDETIKGLFDHEVNKHQPK